MSENYKPGDIAIITDRAGAEEIGICTVGGRVTGGFDAAHWRVASGGEVWNSVAAARPLVVLDVTPVDEEGYWRGMARTLRNEGFLSAADQIEAQARAPKPAEPTGRYAVVEDAHGVEWLRGHSGAWTSQGPSKDAPRANFAMRTWDDIAAVRVLSEGVEVDR